MMERVGFYDKISLICLIIGGILLVTGAYFALCELWLYSAICIILGLLFWHVSTLFAKYAIAASGRQK